MNTETPTHIWIFGKKYLKSLKYLPIPTISISIEDGELVVNPSQEKYHMGHKTVQDQISSFIKRTADNYLRPRTTALAEKMGLKFTSITLKQQKTRWGSCSSAGRLNFNWRLIHFPPPVIDYVIIHELAHLVHMNHSKSFWQLVARYAPDYPKYQGWLKRQGVNMS